MTSPLYVLPVKLAEGGLPCYMRLNDLISLLVIKQDNQTSFRIWFIDLSFIFTFQANEVNLKLTTWNEPAGLGRNNEYCKFDSNSSLGFFLERNRERTFLLFWILSIEFSPFPSTSSTSAPLRLLWFALWVF
jgi:hypothetical protein